MDLARHIGEIPRVFRRILLYLYRAHENTESIIAARSGRVRTCQSYLEVPQLWESFPGDKKRYILDQYINCEMNARSYLRVTIDRSIAISSAFAATSDSITNEDFSLNRKRCSQRQSLNSKQVFPSYISHYSITLSVVLCDWDVFRHVHDKVTSTAMQVSQMIVG